MYGAFYSPQSISRLTQVVEEEVKQWRNCPLAREYYAIYLDGSFLSVRRRKAVKEPVYLALGIRPDGRREILGFWLFGAEGESATNPSSKWQLCVLHTVRNTLAKVRKKGQEIPEACGQVVG